MSLVGIHISPSERMTLEQTDGDMTYVNDPSHMISGKYYFAGRFAPRSYNYVIFFLPFLFCSNDADNSPIDLTRNYATDGITSNFMDMT
jgi:hypothetical protein